MAHLVLVGGGHAHMTVMQNIAPLVAKGHRITLISPVEHHYYSGMSPGMLGGHYTPDELRFNLRQMVVPGGAEFVKDAVIRVRASDNILELASGGELTYDVASFNVGSGVANAPENGDAYLPVKPVVNMVHARERLRELAQTGGHVVVLGGGPAGVEIAGNAWRALREFRGHGVRITLAAGRRLLGGFDPKVQRLTHDSFAERSIAVNTVGYATGIDGQLITFEDGSTLRADLILGATGIRPPTLFADSGLATGPNGGLAVDQYLRAESAPNLFGGGDCIRFTPQPLAKVGVYAVRQNPVLLANLQASLDGRNELTPFEPGGGYLLILNMGDDTAIFRKGRVIFRGQLAMMLKDVIDRRFMKKFKE